jgi:DNA mismatch endonuclease, patch repair protein
MDILTKSERSKRMSQIRSKWTKQETLFHNYLMGNKIKHRMHPHMDGSPDMILTDYNMAIFLHGCFWHSCQYHYKAPVNNAMFWRRKIRNNVARDRRNALQLRRAGWKVKVLWEHQISKDNIRLHLARITGSHSPSILSASNRASANSL